MKLLVSSWFSLSSWCATACLWVLHVVVGAHAAAAVNVTDAHITVGWDRAELQFRLHDGWLLGLAEAQVDGYALTSPDTIYRPLVAQEHGADRQLWPFLRFEGVDELGDGSVVLRCGLYGGSAEAWYRAHYIWRGDRTRALNALTPALRHQQEQASAATAALRAASQTEAVNAAEAALAEAEARDAERGRTRPSRATRRATAALKDARKAAIRALVSSDTVMAAHQATVDAWNQALATYALEFGDLHRDFYAFPVLQRPDDISRTEHLIELHETAATVGEEAGGLARVGTLRWVLTPASDQVAGWAWHGWEQTFEVALDETQAAVIYTLGTWELDGHIDGTTLVNLRFRGLGGIEQPISVDQHGGAVEAWSTTETMPGAAGGAPLVSPVVPPSRTGYMDRGNAIRHRVGAWIVRMARGGGHHFFDFQYRPEAGLIITPVRQDDLRSVGEVMPGDQSVSHTDEERFALGDRLVTTPMQFLALVDRAAPFSQQDWRTRWKEWDQTLRNRVSAELGLVHPQPLPGVGLLWEHQRPQRYTGLAKRLGNWAEQGVRLIASHTPGWWSAQHRNGREAPPPGGGNSNRMYDWVPTLDMGEPWRAFTAACARYQIRYHAYLTGMSAVEGPFYQSVVGPDDVHWGRNLPDSTTSHGYPPNLHGHNLNSQHMSEVLDQRILSTRENFGMQGIWADSFQNMYLSQLSWGDGTAAPNQRLWWEKLAEWSRAGVLFMSESHAFPGLSCSIEVPGWQSDLWYFQYVWKWHRGTSQNDISPERLDEMAFMAMANRGWTAPDGRTDVIPSFAAFANAYLAALPDMQRPYILPNDAGVLWLGAEDNASGILFVLQDAEVPAGLRATQIISREAVARLQRHQVVRLEASAMAAEGRTADVAAVFGIRLPPSSDERIGHPIVIPEAIFPDWAGH